jgi:hypothetical protein
VFQQQNDNIKACKIFKTQDKQIAEIEKLQNPAKKNEFEFKEQENVKDFIEKSKKKQDEIYERIHGKEKKEKSVPKDEFKEDLKTS